MSECAERVTLLGPPHGGKVVACHLPPGHLDRDRMDHHLGRIPDSGDPGEPYSWPVAVTA